MDAGSSEPRRNPSAAYTGVERDPPRSAQPVDHRTRDPTLGLDTQQPTLGATARDEQAHHAYRTRVAQWTAQDVVVVDACGSTIHRTPGYARAPKGQRTGGAVPRNTNKNTTLIASMTPTGMGPAMLLDGATDTAAVATYGAHSLAPTLLPSTVVVLDTVSAHTSNRVPALITARGGERWVLPAYAPDVSPIEEAFWKRKTLLRRAEARTRTALHAAIATMLDQMTALDAVGYFAHCTYGLHAQ